MPLCYVFSCVMACIFFFSLDPQRDRPKYCSGNLRATTTKNLYNASICTVTVDHKLPPLYSVAIRRTAVEKVFANAYSDSRIGSPCPPLYSGRQDRHY